jgi:hypothetical protein
MIYAVIVLPSLDGYPGPNVVGPFWVIFGAELGHPDGSFRQYLKNVPVGLFHNVKYFEYHIICELFMKKVAHRIYKNHLGFRDF